MPGQRREPRATVNPLVERLVESSGGEGVARLEGYVGRAIGQDSIRLYDDLSLTSYVEVPEKDVLQVTEVVDDPHGRVEVFLPKTAEVRAFSIDAERMTAGDYLSGDMLTFLATAADDTKPPKWCKSWPWWRCLASVVVVVTVNVCTATWPCSSLQAKR